MSIVQQLCLLLFSTRDDRNRIKFRRNFRFRPVLPGFGFVRPFFAHFCPFLPIFCPNSPKFARFLPGFAPVSPKFARIRIRSFFAQILQDSFGFVRRPESGFGQAWSGEGRACMPSSRADHATLVVGQLKEGESCSLSQQGEARSPNVFGAWQFLNCSQFLGPMVGRRNCQHSERKSYFTKVSA